MIDAKDYINLVLKKKKWTQIRLVEEINAIEKKMHEQRTYKTHMSMYLNGKQNFSPKTLAKIECALDLPEYTLVSMIESPIAKESQKDLKEYIKKVREVK